uniref:Uncharacterized protein n=2 Tax=Aegilops tauschii subsp. strangulata TaxID=200361 RepID=A0A453N432_AEGTS
MTNNIDDGYLWYMKDNTRSQSYITEWHPRLTTSFMCGCASIQPEIKTSSCPLSKTGLTRWLNMKDILVKISLTALIITGEQLLHLLILFHSSWRM